MTKTKTKPREDPPFSPPKLVCPVCVKRITRVPAGHIIFHCTPAGYLCSASGKQETDMRLTE